MTSIKNGCKISSTVGTQLPRAVSGQQLFPGLLMEQAVIREKLPHHHVSRNKSGTGQDIHLWAEKNWIFQELHRGCQENEKLPFSLQLNSRVTETLQDKEIPQVFRKEQEP